MLGWTQLSDNGWWWGLLQWSSGTAAYLTAEWEDPPWGVVFIMTSTVIYRSTQPPTLHRAGNEYRPKCGVALWPEVKARWFIPQVDEHVGWHTESVVVSWTQYKMLYKCPVYFVLLYSTLLCWQKPTESQVNDDASKKEELQQLTEKFGTKMAYLIFYLRYLFRDSPHSRVIVFSQVSSAWRSQFILVAIFQLGSAG